MSALGADLVLVDGGGERRERQCGPVASGPVATNLRGVWESIEGGRECSRTMAVHASGSCTWEAEAREFGV